MFAMWGCVQFAQLSGEVGRVRTCMLHFLKNISHEPIGYNTKIGTGGVEWGRVDIWIVLHTSFEMV